MTETTTLRIWNTAFLMESIRPHAVASSTAAHERGWEGAEMDEGLKRCPFCGSKAKTDLSDFGSAMIYCSAEEVGVDCPVNPETGFHDTMEHAITAWNTRPEPSTEAMRKALEAAWHALKSYEYGNASPDLAREVGLVIYTALAARAAEQGTEEK